MKRRQFLKRSSGLVGLVPFIPNFGLPNTGILWETDVVKIKVGEFDCTVFHDLQFKYLAKDYFINADPVELNQSLNRYRVAPNNIPSPFIAVLLENQDRKILIDTGIGFSEKPILFRGASYEFKGRLHQLLQQEAIDTADITDVIITHFHPDHIGGIYSEERQLNFPSARFHTHEDEWQYWHSSQSDNQPGMFQLFIEKNIEKLKDRDLHLIKGDFVELLPGITAVKAGGHTPGQIALIIDSENEQLLYISDAFLHPLHMEQINWQTNYDLDHLKAKQSRVKLLELAHKENMLINAFHFDFPGLGRIDKRNSKWNFSEI